MHMTALVLAGGASRRMGMDKLGLSRKARHQNETVCPQDSILAHVVLTCKRVADDVVVLDAPQHPHSDLLANVEGVRIVADPVAYNGPLHALATGFSTLDSRTVGVWVVAGDLPGISTDVLKVVQEKFRYVDPLLSDGVCVARAGRLQPLIGCYRPELLEALVRAVVAGEHRLMAGIRPERLTVVEAEEFGWPKWWTTPVHTPESYRAWLNYEAEGSL